MYKLLFSPIRINRVQVKNRIAYPALGLLYSSDRRLNDRYYNYFRERARGGAGLVTVGPVGVDFIGSGLLTLSLSKDDDIGPMQRLTRIIRGEGARAWVQLFHAGAYSLPILIDGRRPIAPSAEYCRYSRTTPREMSLEDIARVQEAFARSAERARQAGFDGVEIIASAGYLISQFLSPLRNKRTDTYGGSFANRVRFAQEVIALLRRRLGPDYPVTIRMAGNDFVPGSNTDSETPAIAKAYEEAGVDAVNVTGGWHESRVPQLPMELPRSAYAYLALNIKRVVSVPVLASNRIAEPGTAERLLRDGCADMVNLGRVLIADPQWPRKAFEGRAHEIRPCVACSQGCTDQVFSGQPVYCVGNPRAGYEGERNISRTDTPKRVMVAGAGPAGLEAAVTAARAGHRVALYEKGSDIGGQLWLAGAPGHKREILELIRYYRAMLDKHGVALHLGCEVDRALIEAEEPEHLVVAEGAEPALPPVEGIDDARVVTAWEVLADSPPLGRQVAVVGGGSVGLETALFVASRGTLTPEILHFLFWYEAETPERLRELMFCGRSRVTVFEMLPRAGADVGKSTKWILLANLKRHGVRVKTGTRVTSVRDGRVVFAKDGRTRSMAFDNVVLASGSRPVRRLCEAAAGAGVAYTCVGDCVRPGKIGDAIHGGFLAALKI